MAEDFNVEEQENQEYSAHNIQVLEGLEAVRKRPSMYIGDTHIKGLHHLVSEVVDNSIDEALAGYCDTINVTIGEDNSITVSDNGRGIPVDEHEKLHKSALEVVMTVLHAGGKFDKGSYKVSGGLHGVGVSCVNALSDYLRAEVRREGKVYMQEYAFGKPTTEVKVIGTCSDDEHGTTVVFHPDGTIFQTTIYDYAILANRLRDLAYLNAGVTLTIVDLRDKNEEGTPRTETFYSRTGLDEFVRYIDASKEPLIRDVIHITANKGGIPVEVAMTYNTSFNENIYSFVNNINTIEGGTHLTGFRRGLGSTLKKYAEDSKMLEKVKVEIKPEDFREGLTAVISVKVLEPQFEGQTKTKLGNTEVIGAVETSLREALTNYLEEHPAQAKAIVEKVILAATARHAAQSARMKVQRKSPLAGGGLPGKLADCSSKDPRLGRRLGQARPRQAVSGHSAAARQNPQRGESHGPQGVRERLGGDHLPRFGCDHRNRRRPQRGQLEPSALPPHHHHDRCRCGRRAHRHPAHDILLPPHEAHHRERIPLHRHPAALPRHQGEQLGVLLERRAAAPVHRPLCRRQ